MLSVVRRTRYSPPPTVIPSLREDGARVVEGILKCERGTVLSGRLGAVVDGKEMVFEAGEEFAFPAGPMHTWWNAGDELLEVDGTAYPAVDLDRNLQAMFAVLNAGKPEGHRPFMRPTSRTATVRSSTQR